MVRNFLVPLGFALALSGCYSFEGRVNDDVQVSAIIDKIECELQSAYRKNVATYPVLKRWSASFTLDLQRDNVGGVAPSLGYSVPISPDTFKLDASAGVTGKKLRTLNFKRTIGALGDLGDYQCNQAPESGVFTGSLGIEDAFADFIGGTDKGDKVGLLPEEAGYIIEFDVRYEASMTPTVVFSRITGLGVGLSASQEKRNRLTFAFADNPPQVVRPIPVRVINFPHGQSSAIVDPNAGNVPASRPAARASSAGTPRKRAGSRERLYSGDVAEETRMRLDSVLMRMNLQSLRIR